MTQYLGLFGLHAGKVGFCLKWRKWITACLQSATISILVNGSPSKEFVPTRGLRQGDPLAPLLFNIVGEGITGMMREAVQKSLYRSYLVGKNKEPTNIFQYANDTVFVGETSWENVFVLKALLRGFEMAAYEAAQFLNCSQMDTLFITWESLLGLSLQAGWCGSL